MCASDSVRFARYCGKLYSRNHFPYGGLCQRASVTHGSKKVQIACWHTEHIELCEIGLRLLNRFSNSSHETCMLTSQQGAVVRPDTVLLNTSVSTKIKIW